MIWLILAGITSGILGGMGFGGGTILIPLLRIIGVEQQIAQGVNLISFIPMAVVVLFFHEKNNLVRVSGLKKTMILAFLGCVIGAVTSMYVDTIWLKYSYSGLLLFAGIWQIVNVRKKQRASNIDCQKGKNS